MRQRKVYRNRFLKAEGTGSIGYLLLFTGILILCILASYMLRMAQLIIHQQEVDDALADAVLASLIIDDVSLVVDGNPETAAIRLRDREHSYQLYRDIIREELAGCELYENLTLTEFLTFEVDGDKVTVTSFSENGSYITTVYAYGAIRTPAGGEVVKTSAYARVDFDLKSLLPGNRVRMSRDIYCTVEAETLGFWSEPLSGSPETESLGSEEEIPEQEGE